MKRKVETKAETSGKQRSSVQNKPPAKSTNAEAKKLKKFAKITKDLQHATSSRTHRIWTRFVVIFSVMIIVYFYTKDKTSETKFAIVRESIAIRSQKFECSPEYRAEVAASFPSCAPAKCGRFVSDKLVDRVEANVLHDLAKRVMTLTGGGSGGASILDIHTGTVSKGDQFVNVFQLPQASQMFRDEDLKVYNFVKSKIKAAIAEQFGISAKELYLTYPTFFSRLTNATARTPNDEYWHEHVDKETYEAFHYTSLLYLNSFSKDFQGGRFMFVDGTENSTRSLAAIEPKVGRVSAFTSGAENRHHVEPVTEGERYAITISFTCDKKHGIPDPQLKQSM